MPHAYTSTIYIPPNPRSPAFSASLKTSAREKPVSKPIPSSPDTDRSHRETLREPTAPPSTSTPMSPKPPPSPRPSSRSISRQKTPGRERRRCWNRHRSSPVKRPSLKITNPNTTPVGPFNKAPPSYHEWHPTSVLWEYDLQRGLGTSESFFQMCRFFNKAGCEQEGRIGDGEVWKGHERRVAWLLWYWEEALKVKRERVASEAEAMIKEERLVMKKKGLQEDIKNERKTDRCDDEDGLTMEERELVKTLEEEMEGGWEEISEPHGLVSVKDEEGDWMMVQEVGNAVTLPKRKRISLSDLVD
ncbi:MAG: hypothetical protein LQ344_003320 [Seirophora lacunosa]|nr:MAG: hypothetical protein LQ344_003320 [Seirophora lacunosa]